MAKRLFLLLLSSFIGVIILPGILSTGSIFTDNPLFDGTQTVLANENKTETGDDGLDGFDDESKNEDSDSEEGSDSNKSKQNSEENSSNSTISNGESTDSGKNLNDKNDSENNAKSSSGNGSTSNGTSSNCPTNTNSVKEAVPSANKNTSNNVAPASVYKTPANNIKIAGRTINIVDVSDTAVNSGDHVNKYGAKFLYGHNSSAVFGNLVSLGVGSTFSVTYGGVATNYRVARVMIFEKNANNGRLQLNGSGNFMRAVANAKIDGVNYDLSVMTCHGRSYGNGDASHRLVLFANAI